MESYSQFDLYESCNTSQRIVFLETATRQYLIYVLSENDRNGIYSDCDCLADFGQIATKEELIECFKKVIEENY
ncbi:MAG: hypothetical protein [Cryophage ML09]|nr:MAG: hypothetical protein [Cryophage ML09]